MRAALLALCLTALACSDDIDETCPNEPVATFAFDAALVTTLPAGLDPEASLPACAGLGFPETLSFAGTLSQDPGGTAGALCRGGGPILYGIRTGPTWNVETTSNGAVLGACRSDCVARSLVFVRGTVAPDLSAPATFSGGLVEQLWESAGECDGCGLPCAARYRLDGIAEAPR